MSLVRVNLRSVLPFPMTWNCRGHPRNADEFGTGALRIWDYAADMDLRCGEIRPTRALLIIWC